MKSKKLSIVIIARDEEKMLPECIDSVKDWAGEVLVVNNDSTDRTTKVASEKRAKVVDFSGKSFSGARNLGLKEAEGEWIFYLDADERSTPLLKKEIDSIVNNNSPETNFNVYAIPRRNFILGREMRHGGWYPDYVKRLYKKNKLKYWQGELHEEPVFDGEIGHLKNAIIHLKHDNLADMVTKTNEWSEIEAKLLYDNHHPKMSWWRFIRIMAGEFFYRAIKLGGILDGPEGLIYALYQTWSRFLTYAKLWEMQTKK